MNDFTVDDARAYIERVRWQFARTMPQWPHEYTLRKWELSLAAEFDAFVRLIRDRGTVKPWPRTSARPRYHLTYLTIDGWEYWSMDDAVEDVTLINRAQLA